MFTGHVVVALLAATPMGLSYAPGHEKGHAQGLTGRSDQTAVDVSRTARSRFYWFRWPGFNEKIDIHDKWKNGDPLPPPSTIHPKIKKRFPGVYYEKPPVDPYDVPKSMDKDT